MLNGHCSLFSKGLRMDHLRGIIAVAAELRERYPLGVWSVDSRIEGNFRNVLRLHLPSSSMTDWSMISVRVSHLLNFSVGLHGVIAIQNPRRRGPGRCRGGPPSSGRCSRPGSAGRGRRRSLAASIPRHHHVTRQLGVLHRCQIAEPAVEVAVGGIDLPPDLAWRRRQCSQGC